MTIGYSLPVTNLFNLSVITNNAGTRNLTISISSSVQLGHRAELIMSGTKLREVLRTGIIALTNRDLRKNTSDNIFIDKEGNIVTKGLLNNISIQTYQPLPQNAEAASSQHKYINTGSFPHHYGAHFRAVLI